MNKYKVNLIYKEDGLNLTEIIIKTLINELKMICNNNYFTKSDLYSYIEKEVGDEN